jgi:hypothetical protein
MGEVEKTVTVSTRSGEDFNSKHGFTTTVRKIRETEEAIETVDGGRVFVNPDALGYVRETRS